MANEGRAGRNPAKRTPKPTSDTPPKTGAGQSYVEGLETKTITKARSNTPPKRNPDDPPAGLSPEVWKKLRDCLAGYKESLNHLESLGFGRPESLDDWIELAHELDIPFDVVLRGEYTCADLYKRAIGTVKRDARNRVNAAIVAKLTNATRAEPATPPKPKRSGRKGDMLHSEAQALVGDWKAAKQSGRTRCQFCRERDPSIDLTVLESAQSRIRRYEGQKRT